jgi:hypothetical protein
VGPDNTLDQAFNEKRFLDFLKFIKSLGFFEGSLAPKITKIDKKIINHTKFYDKFSLFALQLIFN